MWPTDTEAYVEYMPRGLLAMRHTLRIRYVVDKQLDERKVYAK